MGGVWMLEDTPGGALAECGDFLFLEARDSQTARNLLMAWKREHAGRYAILVARDSALSALVPEVFAGDAALTRRYAFHKGGEAFDRERLACFAACAPADVELRPFDREVCRLAMQAPWSRSFCEQFRDEDDFLARGLGVAALRDGELVGGASSYVCFSGGIELQVETRKDMRRRGVALACCARLILTCLDRGLYPSWTRPIWNRLHWPGGWATALPDPMTHGSYTALPIHKKTGKGFSRLKSPITPDDASLIEEDSYGAFQAA